jgi:hypothetical protein
MPNNAIEIKKRYKFFAKRSIIYDRKWRAKVNITVFLVPILSPSLTPIVRNKYITPSKLGIKKYVSTGVISLSPL